MPAEEHGEFVVCTVPGEPPRWLMRQPPSYPPHLLGSLSDRGVTPKVGDVLRNMDDGDWIVVAIEESPVEGFLGLIVCDYLVGEPPEGSRVLVEWPAERSESTT